METKEIKTNVPEGYEIDKENSTFECIKFKPIKNINNCSYEDVCKNIFINNTLYFVDRFGNIAMTTINKEPIIDKESIGGKELVDTNNSPTINQLKKFLAANKLANIACYCNNYKDAEDIQEGYMILYNKEQDCYEVEEIDNSYYTIAAVDIMFMNFADAQAVIDNPNFRDILDTLCK